MDRFPVTSYHLMIVDDHPLFRDALKQILASALTNVEITEGGSFDELADAIEQGAEVDLVLLDLAMPGAQGFSGLMQLRVRYPELPIVVVSATDNPGTIRRCLQLGALGFIPKTLPVERIREAVGSVLDGQIWVPPEIDLESAADDDVNELVTRLASLTPQQVRVLTMLGEGLLNKQIAFKLSVSEATVKAHVSAILQKLGVDSRTQAVIAINRIDSVFHAPGETGESAE